MKILSTQLGLLLFELFRLCFDGVDEGAEIVRRGGGGFQAGLLRR